MRFIVIPFLPGAKANKDRVYALIEGDRVGNSIVVESPDILRGIKMELGDLCQVSEEAGPARVCGPYTAISLIRGFAAQDNAITDFVLLSDGSKIPKGLFIVLRFIVEQLIHKHEIAVLELYRLCNDKNHVLFDGTATTLEHAGLIGPSNVVDPVVRSIILTIMSERRGVLRIKDRDDFEIA